MAAMAAPGVMKIISGGQTGVDRAALDVAIERGMEWGGWCPSGGWAEDFPDPPGMMARYPNLKETPLSNPVQRTEWNVRDSDASLIITDSTGEGVSIGTRRAHDRPILWEARPCRRRHRPKAPRAAAWLGAQRKRFGASMTLSIGGPRESEAPGIYGRATPLIAAILDRADATGPSDRN
jgi:hypothetical protein